MYINLTTVHNLAHVSKKSAQTNRIHDRPDERLRDLQHQKLSRPR